MKLHCKNYTALRGSVNNKSRLTKQKKVYEKKMSEGFKSSMFVNYISPFKKNVKKRIFI